MVLFNLKHRFCYMNSVSYGKMFSFLNTHPDTIRIPNKSARLVQYLNSLSASECLVFRIPIQTQSEYQTQWSAFGIITRKLSRNYTNNPLTRPICLNSNGIRSKRVWFMDVSGIQMSIFYSNFILFCFFVG